MLKKLIYEKIWILGIVLLICSVFTLNGFYFISNVVQNIYYGIYAILSIITILIIRKHNSLKIHHGFFILFNLLLIYITYVTFIVEPLFMIFPSLLIFPLFCSEKSHGIFKFFSAFSYILLLIIIFVGLIFTSVTLDKSVDSPNNKQMIEVYSISNGAIGGSTRVYLAEKYCYLFKKNRLVYTGQYGEGNDIVKWIDSNHVQIDSKTIYITSR
ncbi:DUF5412 family protein [Clostridium tagluense]|uniref:DUF5412 family protein n=1 Tax=Clostridium tagluense TaxID=360422 RepID=UPI001C6DE37A|nr:DUF5412 family protein [Clostridium tagluense]MBW9159687.1 hypothetical protein [Clostridium tagluense]WLC68361.1 hypothetical protein KTC93_24775 [Clostridium tagluense]